MSLNHSKSSFFANDSELLLKLSKNSYRLKWRFLYLKYLAWVFGKIFSPIVSSVVNVPSCASSLVTLFNYTPSLSLQKVCANRQNTPCFLESLCLKWSNIERSLSFCWCFVRMRLITISFSCKPFKSITAIVILLLFLHPIFFRSLMLCQKNYKYFI